MARTTLSCPTPTNGPRGKAILNLGPCWKCKRFAGQWWMATGTREGQAMWWFGAATTARLWEWWPAGIPTVLSYGGMALGTGFSKKTAPEAKASCWHHAASCGGSTRKGMQVAPTPARLRAHPRTSSFLNGDQSGRVWLGEPRWRGSSLGLPNPTAESIGVRGNKSCGSSHRQCCVAWIVGTTTCGWPLAASTKRGQAEYRADGVFQFTENGAWFKPGIARKPKTTSK